MRGRDFNDDEFDEEFNEIEENDDQFDTTESEPFEDDSESDFTTATDDGNEDYGSEDEPVDNSGGYSDFNTEYIHQNSMERRLTPSQAEMVYLLDADDVPEHLREHIWAITSRHLELIDVPDYRRLISLRSEIRDIIRTSTWKRGMDKLSYSDLIQIEFYAFLLLSKSLNRGERTLLTTSIQRTQVEDYGERTPLSQPAYNAGGLRGMLSNMFR